MYYNSPSFYITEAGEQKRIFTGQPYRSTKLDHPIERNARTQQAFADIPDLPEVITLMKDNCLSGPIILNSPIL